MEQEGDSDTSFDWHAWNGLQCLETNKGLKGECVLIILDYIYIFFQWLNFRDFKLLSLRMRSLSFRLCLLCNKLESVHPWCNSFLEEFINSMLYWVAFTSAGSIRNSFLFRCQVQRRGFWNNWMSPVGIRKVPHEGTLPRYLWFW